MILCDKNCRHQQEGCCALNDISQITSHVTEASCGYFEPMEKKKAQQNRSMDAPTDIA